MCFTSIQLLLNKTTPHFHFYLCLRLTSPNYAFMRCRLYSNQKVIECIMLIFNDWIGHRGSTRTLKITVNKNVIRPCKYGYNLTGQVKLQEIESAGYSKSINEFNQQKLDNHVSEREREIVKCCILLSRKH